MKKIKLLVIGLLISISSFSQILYSSTWSINGSYEFKQDQTKRIISISDTEISISNFSDGSSKTLYLKVDNVIIKDWGYFDGVCKTYYCTDKDIDFFNNHQKVILYFKELDIIKMAMFADEITVYVYTFKIEKYIK